MLVSIMQKVFHGQINTGKARFYNVKPASSLTQLLRPISMPVYTLDSEKNPGREIKCAAFIKLHSERTPVRTHA